MDISVYKSCEILIGINETVEYPSLKSCMYGFTRYGETQLESTILYIIIECRTIFRESSLCAIVYNITQFLYT